jgi:hypothetical protein
MKYDTGIFFENMSRKYKLNLTPGKYRKKKHTKRKYKYYYNLAGTTGT